MFTEPKLVFLQRNLSDPAFTVGAFTIIIIHFAALNVAKNIGGRKSKERQPYKTQHAKVYMPEKRHGKPFAERCQQ